MTKAWWLLQTVAILEEAILWENRQKYLKSGNFVKLHSAELVELKTTITKSSYTQKSGLGNPMWSNTQDH